MKQFVSFTRALLAAFSPGKAHHTRNTFAAALITPLAFAITLSVIASLALAPKAEAQADMFDIASVSWNHNGWVMPGNTIPTAISSGGNGGSYELANGWRVEVNALSATDADFSFFLSGVGLVTTVNLDNSGGSVAVDVVDVNTGLTCHVAIGTAGIDVIQIPNSMDAALAFGLGDDDDVSMGASTDTTPVVLFGGDGSDVVRGGASSDFLYGDWHPGFAAATGNDVMSGSGGNDFMVGGGGDDTIGGHDDDDEMHGDAGNDNMTGGANDDVMHGGDGLDDMFGDGGVDFMFGGANDDMMMGGADGDVMEGNSGDDAMDGGTGVDDLDGGSGKDFLHDDDGTGGDILNGGSEDDQLWTADSSTARDFVDGGSEFDSAWFDTIDLTLTSIEDTPANTGPAGYAPGAGAFADYASWDFSISQSLSPIDFWGSGASHAGPRN